MIFLPDMLLAMMLKVAFGGICAVIANGRGRSGVAWFLLGFFLDCVGLIILLVIPDLRIEQERHNRVARENRRLREQLRKDRMVADARHEDAQRRFVAHDRALGVDTALAQPDQLTGAPGSEEQLAGGTPSDPSGAPARPTISGTPDPSHASKQWYFADHQGRQGPVSFEIMRSLWANQTLTTETYVWAEGMVEWTPIASVAGLEGSLGA